MALNKCLIVFEGSLIMWNFPVDIFKSFKEAYILTYFLRLSSKKYYYDYYGVKYEYLNVVNNDGYYSFSNEKTVPDYVYSLKNKISICDDEKLNSVGEEYHNLSSSWFQRERKRKKKVLLATLKKNMFNYFNNKMKAYSNEIMWTTFKDNKPSLSGKGYTKGFVSVNARATNEFRERKYLAYCANIFLHPIIKQFFLAKKC